jgi:agmatinase
MKHLPATENFLRIEDEQFCAYTSSRYVVYAAPYEHTSSYHEGSKHGPAAIIRASQFVELYDEESHSEPYRKGGICTLSALDFAGKVDEAAVALIEARTDQLLADGKFPIMLGAEHTATLGAIRAFQKRFKNLSVLQIDAHSDLRDSYEGNRHSHASVMARVFELGVPITQVGIRAQSREEAALIRANPHKIHTLYAHQLKQQPLDKWVADAVSHLSEDVYITIDADGFDPSIVPAVGTAEPNGLTWNEGMTLLRAAIKTRNVVGMDVVEIAPAKDSTLSEYTMAKLVYKLIAAQVAR